MAMIQLLDAIADPDATSLSSSQKNFESTYETLCEMVDRVQSNKISGAVSRLLEDLRSRCTHRGGVVTWDMDTYKRILAELLIEYPNMRKAIWKTSPVQQNKGDPKTSN